MIHESCYWKVPLLRIAKRLRAFKAKPRGYLLTDRAAAQFERDIFLGFYSVRKLIEAPTKVTDLTKNMQFGIFYYPSRSKITWLNSHRIDEIYDFTTKRGETRDVMFVCGRIIHSVIFAPLLGDDEELRGIFFASDKDKNKKLYSMRIDDVISVFERVGNDYPASILWRIDPISGKEVFTVA